jgi:ribosome-associated toxin RatA of RatAB toxin-antitoxin module
MASAGRFVAAPVEEAVQIRRSVLVPYPVEKMFDLIEQAEHYPKFVPWCVAATILDRSDISIAAKVDFSFLDVRFALLTRNAKQRPDWLRLRVVDGPFHRFEGDWRLTPLGDLGCKIEFDVSYEIGGSLLQRVGGPTVGFVSRSMIDAFVKRAEHVCREAS